MTMWSSFLLAVPLLASFATAQNVDADLQTIYERRIPTILSTLTFYNETTLSNWVATETNGQFPDVDYTTGCPARRANWPAQGHWNHLNPLAAAYKDLWPHTPALTQTPPKNFSGNATVKAALDSALNYWFQNDFTDPGCIDQGGLTNNTCPCGTAGLWNQNWFSNVILIPRLATYACVLLNDEITPEQRQSCINMGERGYSVLDRFVYGLGYIAGANTLDISNNGISVGLLRHFGGLGGAVEIITDAFRRIHDDLVVKIPDAADGIRPDGSFGQHLGILYNGNYGKDYTNLVLGLEIQAAGTQFAANQTSKDAFATMVDGFQWMIYNNVLTKTLHWDISTIGRFLSFPVSDLQASSGIKMNLTQIQELGNQWESQKIVKAATSLAQNVTTSNAGKLVGNRMFYDNDYMVQRGTNYVTTLKMISTRTSNTECINLQNPFGFHLSQGVVFHYQSGNEYEDIQAAWDWNLLPGITTDYAATPLDCNHTQWTGNETFVGGASNPSHRELGVAAMRYLNPLSGTFRYQKAWFFFEDDVQHVTVSSIQSGSTAEVYSVLDQKRTSGDIYVNGQIVAANTPVDSATASTLWHGGVGYVFENVTGSAFQQLSVRSGDKTGNWSTIGTSTVGVTTVNLFSAWIKHNPANLAGPVSYSIYPATSTQDKFAKKAKSRSVKTIKNDDTASVVVDGDNKVVMAVFWPATGGEATVPLAEFIPHHSQRSNIPARFIQARSDVANALVRIKSDHAITLIVDFEKWEITAADPTHLLTSAVVTISLESSSGSSTVLGKTMSKPVNVAFPQGGFVGQSVVVKLA